MKESNEWFVPLIAPFILAAIVFLPFWGGYVAVKTAESINVVYDRVAREESHRVPIFCPWGPHWDHICRRKP